MHPAMGLLHQKPSGLIKTLLKLHYHSPPIISSCSTGYKIAVFFFTVVNNYFIALPSVNRFSTPLVPVLILGSLNDLYLTKPQAIFLSLHLALKSAAYLFVVKKSLSAWRLISIVKWQPWKLVSYHLIPLHSKAVNKLYTKKNHSIYTKNLSNTV